MSAAKPRGPGRPWTKGVSGNPAGRKHGSRHQSIVMLDRIGASVAQDVLAVVVAAAKNGNLDACEAILRRVWPPCRSKPVVFAMPLIESASDLPAAIGSIAAAMASGQVTPEQASAIVAVLEAHRRAIETAEIAERVTRLEQRVPHERQHLIQGGGHHVAN